MTEVALAGLRTRPLSSYLAAIGLFRVLGEQVDPSIRGWWQGSTFRVDSTLDLDEIGSFLLDDYAPTPLVAPWSGAHHGGFSPIGPPRTRNALAVIADQSDPRFDIFQTVIASMRALYETPVWRTLSEQADGDRKRSRPTNAAVKRQMILLMRNHLPDPALVFLDASIALTSDGVSYPILLGTGANVGRTDLVMHYMENLGKVIGSAQQITAGWLESLLSGHSSPLAEASLSQYDYHGIGGQNLTKVDASASMANPWEFVLAIEGALAFEATTTRRLGTEASGSSAPFTMASSPAGFASASVDEGAKGETWMPIWARPWSLLELLSVLAEGRASWKGRQARSGTDFVRSARTLGVDRGITAFERYAFLERNGTDQVAIAVGRVRVADDPGVRLTAELDPWVRRLNFGADSRVPASVRTTRNQVNQAVFAAGTGAGPRQLRHLLLCVARAERAVERSAQFQESSGIGPVPDLSSGWWDALRNTEPEQRIAFLLAMGHDRWGQQADGAPTARSLREHLRPVVAGRLGGIAGFRRGGSLVTGLGTRPVTDLLADVAVLRARTAPEPSGDLRPPIRGVRVQFPVRRIDAEARDPRGSRSLVERFATGDLELGALSQWLEILLLLRPVAELEFDPAFDAAQATDQTRPEPVWRLFAPWFGQGTLLLDRGVGSDGSVSPSRLVPAVRSTWPARLRHATPMQLAGLAREVRSSYGAARLSSAIDPAMFDAARPPQTTISALAALMVPTRVRDLADLATDHLHIVQGANQ